MSSSASFSFSTILGTSIKAANHAGKMVRDIMKGGDLSIVEKTGANDLQTAADRAANDIILGSLMRAIPDLVVIGEEGIASANIDPTWLVEKSDEHGLQESLPESLLTANLSDFTVWVDPLDATKEYTEGFLDHVTVLIGIALGKKAVAGVIHQPFYGFENEKDFNKLGRTFYGVIGAGTVGIEKTPPPSEGIICTTTRSHSNKLVNAALEAVKPTEVLKVGGSGHKVLLLIEGKAHAYVFPSPGCKKWDTCAPEAILHALGGKLTDFRGEPYPYDKDATWPDEHGVLATAIESDHAKYLKVFPEDIKGQIKDYYKKK